MCYVGQEDETIMTSVVSEPRPLRSRTHNPCGLRLCQSADRSYVPERSPSSLCLIPPPPPPLLQTCLPISHISPSLPSCLTVTPPLPPSSLSPKASVIETARLAFFCCVLFVLAQVPLFCYHYLPYLRCFPPARLSPPALISCTVSTPQVCWVSTPQVCRVSTPQVCWVSTPQVC